MDRLGRADVYVTTSSGSVAFSPEWSSSWAELGVVTTYEFSPRVGSEPGMRFAASTRTPSTRRGWRAVR
jgi:hypothetical protein